MSKAANRQLVLRMPDSLKHRLRAKVEEGKTDDIEFHGDEGKQTFKFSMDGATYPARLVNLPCPVETYKTIDTVSYIKSGDVGQALIVYETEADYKRAESNAAVTEQEYFPHGLTPPMLDVVTRRFVKARPAALRGGALADMDPGQRKAEVFEAETRLNRLMGITPAAPLEATFEEVVDFEPWMLDLEAAKERRVEGLSFEIRGAGGSGGGATGGGPGREKKDKEEPPAPTVLGARNTLLGHRILFDHPEILLAARQLVKEEAAPAPAPAAAAPASASMRPPAAVAASAASAAAAAAKAAAAAATAAAAAAQAATAAAAAPAPTGMGLMSMDEETPHLEDEQHLEDAALGGFDDESLLEELNTLGGV